MQLKAVMRSQDLTHCSPAATHATFPSGDISGTNLGLIPPEGHEGERTNTKDNHDLVKPDLNPEGAENQVE